MLSGRSAYVKEGIFILHAESNLKFQNLIVWLISEKKIPWFLSGKLVFFLFVYGDFS